MLLQGCSRTRGHGYHSSTWSCSCGLFISNNAIKPSEVPHRFPFAAPLFGCSRVRGPLCVCMLIWSWNSSLIYCTSGNEGSVHAQSSVASSHKNFYIAGWIGYSQNFIPYTLGIAETTECQRCLWVVLQFVWMYLAVAFMVAAAACQLVLSQGQAPIHATT
ncbi:uncharacterized protein LOC125551238 isoform X1 [Triticum urartu]|uniref:Uncharacterized protein n=1 Tax=Triticum urartu TaxID=4572 RepID=A0A8R7Q3D3_TRIUA|nr:uncharacterized protein LOC125529898 [Triticum urartu]XP_048550274.1 uncharacterized protein LOC125529898 [Triticum urartu]XP_048570346.1 uncharacterized protein LOC125551238 isoform X1 [Triticum urartu]XP_048570348.1 uncharacterized protein LOC125551238 isoform X1 [Triticum urartu]